MTATAAPAPQPGFTYAERRFCPDASEERRLLGIVGTDPAVFDGGLDPAAFITLAIEEQVRNGLPSSGGVNMVQWLDVTRLPRLGEELVVSGGITGVSDAPRGRVTTSEVRYRGTDGTPRVASGRVSLRTDPTKHADPRLRGAGKRPDPAIDDPASLEVIEAVQLTPEIVLAYSLNTTNPVHTDMDAAQRAGYRAPIIGGAHGVRYLTRAVWARLGAGALRMDIRFRRPIHWDDAFEVRLSEGPRPVACLSRAGKVLVEMVTADSEDD